MTKKIYVLDTSVCLTDANVFYAYKNNDITIPLKVLEEIDKHKNRQDIAGGNARRSIKFFDGLRSKGTLSAGVRIAKGKGILRSKRFEDGLLPEEYPISVPDNQIIATALTEIKNNPKRKVILVSRDINMRVKCDSLNISTEDYEQSKSIISNRDELYSGLESILVDDQTIEAFYNKNSVYLDKDEIKKPLYPNQFLILVSNSNEKKTALARFKDFKNPLKDVLHYKNDIWGILPKNKEQTFAMNLLLDPEIPVVTLVGKSGSGKTLISLAAGLQQTLKTGKNSLYKRMLVSKPIHSVGKEMGFLPGSKEEKMLPWLAPIQDNLRFMIGDKTTLEDFIDEGTIELEAISYIRGRSIPDSYIIIDETQNLSIHELRTILTRVGENTKIVLTGDIDQIDNTYVNDTTNGLTHAIEKFKNEDIAGHVTLTKGERSKVATISSKIL